MGLLLDVLSWICLVGGGFFCIAGGVGVLRLPDFFSRLHASGVIDTLGAGLILLGLLLQTDSFAVAIRLVLIFVLLLMTVPTATHALAKSALHGGLEPELDDHGGGPSNT
jgi:multicomponent Na+:H+ antiporter subunit G